MVYINRWMFTGSRLSAIIVPTLLLIGTSVLVAQSVPFTERVEKADRILPPGGFTTYELVVHNTSLDSVPIRVRRIVNDLPDSSWHGSICSEFNCYAEDVSILPAVMLKAGDSTEFKMHILAGAQVGSQANIMLRVDTGEGSEGVDQKFTVKVELPPDPIFEFYAAEVARMADPGTTIEFPFGLHNRKAETLPISVTRVENNFPDRTWHSQLCGLDSCYPEGVSTTRVDTVDENHATYYTLKVTTGATSGVQGKVTLRFDAGPGIDPIYQQFTVTTTTLGVEPARAEDQSMTGIVYPNPASGIVTIGLPPGQHSPRRVALKLFDTGGRLVASFHDASPLMAVGDNQLRLDVSGLMNGWYMYMISADGATTSGELRVAR